MAPSALDELRWLTNILPLRFGCTGGDPSATASSRRALAIRQIPVVPEGASKAAARSSRPRRGGKSASAAAETEVGVAGLTRHPITSTEEVSVVGGEHWLRLQMFVCVSRLLLPIDALCCRCNIARTWPNGSRRFSMLFLHNVLCAPLAPQAVGLMAMAQSNRRVASHSYNSQSSRSHLVLTIHLRSAAQRAHAPRSKGKGRVRQTAVRHSKLRLIDLAGSERLSKTARRVVAWETMIRLLIVAGFIARCRDLAHAIRANAHMLPSCCVRCAGCEGADLEGGASHQRVLVGVGRRDRSSRQRLAHRVVALCQSSKRRHEIRSSTV